MTAQNDTESALMLRVATGDHVAFTDLYTRTCPRIFGLVLHVLHDPAQSEEVVQEVYLELWRRAAHFDPDRGGAIAWMFRLAHGRAVDRVRASESSRARDADVGMRELAVPAAPLDERLELEWESRRLERALAALPRQQRDAVELTHLLGLTHSEAARRLGIPVGTVKTRVRGGLARMRNELRAA